MNQDTKSSLIQVPNTQSASTTAQIPTSLTSDTNLPSQTLYVNNLNERVNARFTMRRALKNLFSRFGPVRKVTCRRVVELRGQAWVEMENLEDAAKAQKELNGLRIYGKSMNVRFARTKSFYWASKDGTWEHEKWKQDYAKATKRPRITRRQMLAQAMANPAMAAMMNPATSNPSLNVANLPYQTAGVAPVPPSLGTGGIFVSGTSIDVGLPNKTLFIQGIPPSVNEAELIALYKRFPGFDDVRLVPNRPDMAFVEFATESQAAQARQQTDNLVMRPEHMPIRVVFTRK